MIIYNQHPFNKFLQESLNDKQKQIVIPKSGILLVHAGAGSGKTRIITARIANLIINHNVKPSNIIALTFTNKAAREMKERVSLFLGNNSELPFIGTFHSYCLKLLKNNQNLLPFKEFSLLDEDDQNKIVRKIIQKNGLTKKFSSKTVISFISKIKNKTLISSERNELLNYDNILKEIFFLYETEKQNAHCLDFDDLLIYTLEFFEKNEPFKKNHQNTIHHILIDEYQDTNEVQHALLKNMCLDENKLFVTQSLCVVGDEDQSIYSWRGATISNIINFGQDFPNLKNLTIEQNYRSVQHILDVANNLIKHNIFRNPKKLWSEQQANDRVRLITSSSDYQEGEIISKFLKLSQSKNSQNSYAILYRSHFQSRALEEALIRNSIPYKIIGGIQFYERLEIKDILAYLKLIVNPYDRLAFIRIINVPPRGFGEKFEESFLQIWDQQPFLDFRSIIEFLLKTKQVQTSKANSLKKFLSIFDNLTISSYASQAINQILLKTEYYTYLETNFDQEEAKIKKENIKELIHAIAYFESNTQQTIDGFLQEVALLQDLMNNIDESSNHVKLMTLHAAKGLEFNTVILTGLEEGILPSTHTLYQEDALEEERRLLYVGITRARERLLLTHTKYRYTYGNITEQRPSRFIQELSDSVQKFDYSYCNEEQYISDFLQWISNSPKQIKINLEKNDPNKINSIESKNNQNFIWKPYQTVSHKKFGIGIIQKVEEKTNTTFLTIKFKEDIKKVDSKFIDSTL